MSKRPSTLSHSYSLFLITYPYPFPFFSSHSHILTLIILTIPPSPMLIRYYSKAFFTLPIPHKHIHIPSNTHLYSPSQSILVEQLFNYSTIYLLLPIVSSKIPETRSTTGFQGNFTSNFSQWK